MTDTTRILIDTKRFKAVQEAQRERARANPENARITSRAKIRVVRDQLKEARVGQYTILCDEAAHRGGGGEYPGPLSYFIAAIGF